MHDDKSGGGDGRDWRDSFDARAWAGKGGFFGRNGPFGPRGPFGATGPFGASGPFGDAGMFGPDGFFGEGRKWAGGKPRGRRRMFGSGELRLVLLYMLAEQPRHGYELIKAIEELTHGSYAPSPGTVYPTLSLLEDEGAISPVASDDTKKAYEATEAGRRELEERADEVEALFERLSGHGEHRRSYATPEMFRAVGNLATVLKNRARGGQLEEHTVREIVDLIDDLAKKIERL